MTFGEVGGEVGRPGPRSWSLYWSWSWVAQLIAGRHIGPSDKTHGVGNMLLKTIKKTGLLLVILFSGHNSFSLN